jgi:hypothetical protein
MTDIKTIWQSQPEEEKDMITLSEIRDRAERFQALSHWRNIALYVYSVANIAASAWLILSGRLAAYTYPMLLMVGAHLFVLWQVNMRISARALPEELAGRTALDHHRHELERQRDALENAWLWYITPFMPALIWEIWIRANTFPPNIPPGANFRMVLFIALGAVFFWTAVWLAFSRAALKVQLQIERLNLLKVE